MRNCYTSIALDDRHLSLQIWKRETPSHSFSAIKYPEQNFSQNLELIVPVVVQLAEDGKFAISTCVSASRDFYLLPGTEYTS